MWIRAGAQPLAGSPTTSSTNACNRVGSPKWISAHHIPEASRRAASFREPEQTALRMRCYGSRQITVGYAKNYMVRQHADHSLGTISPMQVRTSTTGSVGRAHSGHQGTPLWDPLALFWQREVQGGRTFGPWTPRRP
jgi:hypothetical protein